MKHRLYYIFICFVLFTSCKITSEPEPINTYIESVIINGTNIINGGNRFDVPVDSVVFHITFSQKIDKSRFNSDKISFNNGIDTAYVILPDTNTNELILKIKKRLDYYTSYQFTLYEGENFGIKLIDTYNYKFLTELDTTPRFPTISDDSLMTLIQKRTFAYFWDHGHPVSGLARERYGSGETVTIGGSGFGVMSLLVGINRGFITRAEGFERLNTIVNFLNTKADRFHGAFSHWLNGSTGAVQPFSAKDNGADLVETAFMIEGLLTVQQYFKDGSEAEKAMCDTIQKIWEGVEWTWFQQNSQQKLYWHWSPSYNWDMNMQISGWDEALIVYVLAASSPTYPITKSVYDNGWAQNGAFKNGKTFYNIILPLGSDKGGPMFFAHYSFLGLDPRNLSDQYANYWEQNTAHAKINYSYCVANPKKYFGYSEKCWGLTASDIPSGYTASSPTNDVGTIAPTAALASFPYTPEESMKALKFFYYVLGDKLLGTYGFKDAFDLNQKWFATSYLAIDQGPIVVMMENYRTGLLWNLFMQNNNIQQGLTNLGFTY